MDSEKVAINCIKYLFYQVSQSGLQETTLNAGLSNLQKLDFALITNKISEFFMSVNYRTSFYFVGNEDSPASFLRVNLAKD